MRTTKKIAEHEEKKRKTHESKHAKRAQLQAERGREDPPLNKQQGVRIQTDIMMFLQNRKCEVFLSLRSLFCEVRRIPKDSSGGAATAGPDGGRALSGGSF